MSQLSKRERQVLDILYRRGEASVSDVQEDLGEGINYNATRGLLWIMHEKDLVVRREEGTKHYFSASVPKTEAATSALQSLVRTFFGGSVQEAVVTLISQSESNLSPEEIEELAAKIKEAREAAK